MANQIQTQQVPIPRLGTSTPETIEDLMKELRDILNRQERQNAAFHSDIATLISRTNTHGI